MNVQQSGEDGRRILIEEAYSLAILGRLADAQRLIDAALGVPGESLCRARVFLALGAAGSRDEARKALEALVERGGQHGWRAAIDLARLARVEGRLADAAALLQRAIADFRRTAGTEGHDTSPLAALLTREVDGLREQTGGGKTSHPSARSDDAALALDPAALVRLVELGKRLAEASEPDDVLRIVLHEALELTGTERGFIVLVTSGGFEFALAENLDRSEVQDPSFEVSRTLIRKVLEESKPLMLSLPDVRAAQATSHSLGEIGSTSVACVPILHAGQALGVLYIESRAPAHAFSRPMGRLLDLFAAQAGAALDNARAHSAKSRALEAAEEALRRHRSESVRQARYDELVGSSDAMQEVYRKLDRIVPTELPVIVLGETGTGKEVAARLIHSRGPRASRDFIATNCAGIAESLLEAELFGHERGAFTGADRSRPGLFELAHKGTLFLDEIGDMSLRMQADLLRVLQSGELRRVGGRETIHVDVRVIAATHRNLEEQMERGEFRQDLYFRLNVLTLELPPLRERPDDIPPLASELLARLTSPGQTATRISDRAMRRLVAYSWPGNVRELQNVLRRVGVLEVEVVEERHLPSEILRASPRAVRPGSLRRAEEEAVRQALAAARGNKAEAARILGVDRKTLYAKLGRLAHGKVRD